MKPVKQTKFGFPYGNCMAACAASILEIPLEDVPDFTADYDASSDDADQDRVFWQAWYAWWRERGYHCVMLRGRGIEQDLTVIDGWEGMPVLLGGKSPRGEWGHCVVGKMGRYKPHLVHDPHPDGTGLEQIEDITLLIPAWTPAEVANA